MEDQEINEDNMLVGDFFTPQTIQRQSSIDEDNMLFGDFLAMQYANTARYEANSVIDEDNMLFGDFLAMQYVNTARYEDNSVIDEDNMLFGDFLAMQHANIARYGATSDIDEDNMLVGEFITDHPNFSWNDNYNNIRSQGPQFQEPEKRTSLEDILGKFIEKTDQFMRQTEINLQNQSASIKNLEIQIGQMAVAISARVQSTLSSNTEVNPNESVTSVTIRSDVQLPEIHVKRHVANKENESSTDEEHVEQTEQTTDIKASSCTPQVIATVPIKPYEPPIQLSQRLQKHESDNQFSNSSISSKIDFVIKVDEEVEIFVVVFEQDATLKPYFYGDHKFKILRINEKWRKVNRCTQSKSSKALFRVP